MNNSEWIAWDKVPAGAKVAIKDWSTYTYRKKLNTAGAYSAFVIGEKSLRHSNNPESYLYKLLENVEPEELKPYFTGFKYRDLG